MKYPICTAIFSICLQLTIVPSWALEEPNPVKAVRSILSPQGINLPKRSSFIHGLNEQFKPKLSIIDVNKYANSSNNSPSSPASFLAGHLPTFLLGGRAFQLKQKQQQQLTQQQLEQQALANLQEKQTLYLDKHQQELLAANPNLPIPKTIVQIQQQVANKLQTNQVSMGQLMPPVNPVPGVLEANLMMPNLGEAQIQKSLIQSIPLGDPLKYQYLNNNNNQANLAANGQLPLANAQKVSQTQQQQPQQQQDTQQQQQQQNTQQPNQLYKGYSLIELDIKNEADRRYMKEMYANLSAVINEQAANANMSPSVSPHVDVDFWSFGRQSAMNDQIDVMVSPRSKPFLMAQLAKAKIRYRIKVDDIQARIDRDQTNHQQFSGDDLQWLTPPGQFSYTSSSSITSSLGDNGNKQRESSLLFGRQAIDGSQSGTTSGPGSLPGGGPIIGNTKLVNDSAFFENYQRLALINQYMEYIVQRDSDVAQVKVIGRSSQARHLRVLKLGYERMDGDNWSNLADPGSSSTSEQSTHGRAAAPGQLPNNNNNNHRAQQQQYQFNATHIMQNFFKRQFSIQKLGSIWLDGGTHAREWISVSTVLYLAFRLSDNHNRCNKFYTSLKSMVNDYEHLVAMANQQFLQQQQQQNQHHNANLAATVTRNQLLDVNSLESGKYADIGDSLNTHNHQTVFQDTQKSSLVGREASSSNNANVIQASGGSTTSNRPRSEMEQMLELIAKSPQVVASEYGCDLEVEQLLRRYTFFIMPVLNPDGYEYSHTHNRLWRKTRSTSNHPIYRHFCLGADPNRNYDAQHGSTGSSSHPCSQTYAGATPFTEPETRHQSNFVYANRFGMKMYISFHSYSQMILLPLSHSKGTIPDLKDLESVGLAASKAIEQTHGTQYKVGQSAAILYTAAGTASDWAYEKANIKYSYTIELRDTGSYGFLLPRQQIIPTGEETFNGLLAMIAQMEKNDNLLTSKSTVSQVVDGVAPPPALIDYNRASPSDLERLNVFGHNNNNKQRAQLETVNSAAATNNELTSAEDTIGSSSISSISTSSKDGPLPIGSGPPLAELGTGDTDSSIGSHAIAGSSLIQGARDRRPVGTGPEQATPPLTHHHSHNRDSNTISNGDWTDEDSRGHRPEMSLVDPLGQPVNQPDAEHDAESGYAFEGEGELMEPAASSNENDISNNNNSELDSNLFAARAHVAETKLTSRRMDSARRIVQKAHLSGNGRNSINTMAPKALGAQQVPPKRESSGNHLIALKNQQAIANNNQKQQRASSM